MTHSSNQPDLSIIIPTHRRRDMLQELLERLLASREVSLEVIVLDDASSDGTEAMLRNYPSVNVIRNDTPQGFDALPKAINSARSDLLLFLDDDAYPAPGSLRTMVEHMHARGDKLGVVALPFMRPGTDRLSYTPYFPPLPDGADYVPTRSYHAGAVLIRRETAKQAPPSPQGYFMYETEIPAIIEYLDQGWEADYLPSAPIYHIWNDRGDIKGRATVKARAAYLPFRNDLVTIHRYFRGWRRVEMLMGRYFTGFIHLSAAGEPWAVLTAHREANAMLLSRPKRHVDPHILSRVYPCFEGLTLMTFFSETNRRRLAWFLGRLPIDQIC
ncbi:MAG: glycosyltransferase family 2 protein [Deinococcota bacterium]